WQRLPKRPADAMSCVAYWTAVADPFVGAPPPLRKAAWAFHASRERGRLSSGPTDEPYKYLRHGMDGRADRRRVTSRRLHGDALGLAVPEPTKPAAPERARAEGCPLPRTSDGSP